MALFNLEQDFNNVLKMDGPISRGPTMRWQRKLNESSSNTSSNLTSNSSLLQVSSSLSFSKSPSRRLRRSSSLNSLPTKDNGSNKSTPSRRSKTPGRSKTPTSSGKSTVCTAGGDRFIPNRFATDFEYAQHRVGKAMQGKESESRKEYDQVVSANCSEDLNKSNKILKYQRMAAPAAPEGHLGNLRVLYSQHKTPSASSKKSCRHIPSAPDKILDAPDLIDDYYLNLLSWSCSDLLAVPLGASLYIWNSSTGNINQLLELDEQYISSASWASDGNFLGIATSSGDVQIWDVSAGRKLRSMSGHDTRVGSLSWNNHILSSGCRTGSIHHHDVRVANHLIGQAEGHTQEVCGLQWSPDGKYLASGSNDNILNIWSNNMNGRSTEPVHSFTQHQAAVKALAWCPWQSNILASGGGTADRTIRIWNCNTGVCLSSTDTKSQYFHVTRGRNGKQLLIVTARIVSGDKTTPRSSFAYKVCSVLWSKEHRELISSHGFPDYNLTIWKYPAITKVTDLSGHTARVLHMALSPDGTTVVSAAADETIRLWKCFDIDPVKAKAKKAAAKSQCGPFTRGIR